MQLGILAFLAGILTLPWFSAVPPLIWFLPILLVVALLWYFSYQPYRLVLQLLLLALVGCGYILLRAQHILNWQLPENLETTTISITGEIASLTKIEGDEAHFELRLDGINAQPQRTRIQLAWYHYDGIPLKIGDRWQFRVRLKRPHGLLNPGGFDYEKVLFSKGIRATGYVIDSAQARLLQARPFSYPLDRLRQYLQQKIDISLADQSTGGLVAALIMGAQNHITQQQWQIMRATGTNHLMAIAGVHIAFVCGFVYAWVNFLWRCFPRLMLIAPAQQAAACGSWVAALGYSALAGFALPTQRALIMLSVFMLSLWGRRELNVWNSYLLAVLLVILLDPLATLSISFWLSFGAVFAIIYGVSGRLKPQGLWWKYGRVQWVISIVLIPISLTLFQQSSLIAFIANFFAVPAVGILVLPLCLLGALLITIAPWLGHWILWLAAKILAVIWWLLGWLGGLQGAIWQQFIPTVWILYASLVGVLLLITPRGFPARWLGLWWLSPLIFFHPIPLPLGGVRLTLLDVGQGLAAIVQTKQHTLIYDAGPLLGKYQDAGKQVIVPFLRVLGVSMVDLMVISHGDSDHIGGAFSLLKQMPVLKILTSVPQRFSTESVRVCSEGQAWRWDGVDFQMLYPPADLLGQGNNSSCVLKIKTKKGAILLTGDIEKSAEKYLLQQASLEISAVVLVAPHHGSRTSSTTAFVKTVRPAYVLFATGYKNRYRFPHPLVVERYQKKSAKLLETAKNGAISVEISDVDSIKISAYRQQEKRIWHEDFSVR